MITIGFILKGMRPDGSVHVLPVDLIWECPEGREKDAAFLQDEVKKHPLLHNFLKLLHGAGCIKWSIDRVNIYK